MIRQVLGTLRNVLDQHHLDRPTLVIASDDWGLVGHTGTGAGADGAVGRHAFDQQTFETSDDVAALVDLLTAHQDRRGRSAVVSAFFVLRNIDPAASLVAGRPVLVDLGTPADAELAGDRWPAYAAAVEAGALSPAFHGLDHANVRLLARALDAGGPRAETVRAMWDDGIAYAPGRAPWAAYAFEDGWEVPRPEPPAIQAVDVAAGLGRFADLFGRPAVSACPPGYRGGPAATAALRAGGVDVVHLPADGGAWGPRRRGGPLLLPRNVKVEPGIFPETSVDEVLSRSLRILDAGYPAVLCTHALNFHSTPVDRRARTLAFYDELLGRLLRARPALSFASSDEVPDLLSGRRPSAAALGEWGAQLRGRNEHLGPQSR